LRSRIGLRGLPRQWVPAVEKDVEPMSLALEARDITKVYGHVSALSEANFEVKAGEVVALIGDNGAGKSTLVKILSGTETPTSGEILVDGQPVTIDGPLAARRYGIETVYQDLALAPHLNPVQNMYLGREIMRSGLMGRLGFMNNTDMLAGSKKAFDELGATVRNFSGSIGAMSGGQKQAVKREVKGIRSPAETAGSVVRIKRFLQNSKACLFKQSAEHRGSEVGKVDLFRTASLRNSQHRAEFLERPEPQFFPKLLESGGPGQNIVRNCNG